MNPDAVNATLIPYPGTGNSAVEQLRVEISTPPAGGLHLRYLVTGDLTRLRLPPETEPARRDGLWRHTCCEAFIGTPDSPRYLEYNFAPSRHWASYAFRDYRAPAPEPTKAIAPLIVSEFTRNRLTLSATLPPAVLPAVIGAGSLLLGLAMVLEADDGCLSYWALTHTHAAERPDFHHRTGFALRWPPGANPLLPAV
ncbi:MAG: DOMON-like domain-containing protein [Thiotrichales bacterium]